MNNPVDAQEFSTEEARQPGGDTEYELRKLLAGAYGGALIYGDDGELQDNRCHPLIDFKRDSVSVISEKMLQRATRAHEREQTAGAEPLKAGTPSARLAYILAELEKRFPNALKPFESYPPEFSYFAALDEALLKARKSASQAQQESSGSASVKACISERESTLPSTTIISMKNHE